MFERILREASIEEAGKAAIKWTRNPPVSHEGYRELLSEIQYVLQEWLSLPHPARERITYYVLKTIQGMSRYVARTTPSSELQLKDMADLQEYCYVVAGVVGEMITDLFVIHYPDLAPYEQELHSKSLFFGEGLQLVNILKDSSTDAKEGRFFLPPALERREIFDLARLDLDEAARYIVIIQAGNPPSGVLKFLTLPLFLAWPTLDQVDADGSGAKITRQEVIGFIDCIQEAFESKRRVFDFESLRGLYLRAKSSIRDYPGPKQEDT